MNTRFYLIILVVLLGCETPVSYQEDWLDAGAVQDPSLVDPFYRVSTRPGLTAADRSRPVVIAVHGYSATTYEWQEFAAFAESRSNVLVSRVLLGGHGRSVEAFRASSWEDWGRPIVEEFNALREQGYTNISLAGSSTAGALLVAQFTRGAYDGLHPVRYVFFVDPIVVPGDKMLKLIPLLGPVVGNVHVEMTDAERAHWYSNRPAETLAQLNDLLGYVRRHLIRGVTLPGQARAVIFKTARDKTADPVSALYLYRGLTGTVWVEMLDSDLHVFTRLAGRAPGSYGAADVQRQLAAFRTIVEKAGGTLR